MQGLRLVTRPAANSSGTATRGRCCRASDKPDITTSRVATDGIITNYVWPRRWSSPSTARFHGADDSYPNRNGGSLFLSPSRRSSVVWYIVAGGIVGTLSRYYLQGWVQARVGPPGFPTGTLAINLLGSLAVGFIIRLTIGFCGAFTTMSTFSYESMKLLADGEYWYAGLYMGGTIVGCLAAVLIGTMLANRLL